MAQLNVLDEPDIVPPAAATEKLFPEPPRKRQWYFAQLVHVAGPAL